MFEIRTKGITLFIADKLHGDVFKKQNHYYYKDKEGMVYEIEYKEYKRLGGTEDD